MMDKLDKEGDIKVVVKTNTRVKCEFCRKPADEKHTYLLPNARSNPKSSGYKKDDLSWCSDKKVFTCDNCRVENFRGSHPVLNGYEICSTFGVGERFAHMFLEWSEMEVRKSDVSEMSAIQLWGL